MARIPSHGTREGWLETAVEALRTLLREYAGLILPPVRLSCGVHRQGRRGEAYIGKTVDEVAEINISLLHKAEASAVLGTLIRLCIYVATDSQAHGAKFQRIARQCGLAPLNGTWATAGYPDATAVPSWVRPVLAQLGPWPAPRLQFEAPQKKQSSRWITVVCESCTFRWKSSQLHLNEAPIRCPRVGCDGEQVIQRPDDTDSVPHAEGRGVTFKSAKHPGKSCTRKWHVGKVVSERQAGRVHNALCGLPDCRCRHFAPSGASLEEITNGLPGLGRQFVVRRAQQPHEHGRTALPQASTQPPSAM